MIFGVLLDIILAFSISLEIELPVVTWILAIFATIGLLGLIISTLSYDKTGPIIVLISCICFLPFGIIAGLSARNALDALKRKEFGESKF
jgi:hypothetical protein